jgi:hypothetical protein
VLDFVGSFLKQMSNVLSGLSRWMASAQPLNNVGHYWALFATFALRARHQCFQLSMSIVFSSVPS